MKLFVTGGAGFIGSNFIRYWLSQYPEDEIINFDALTYAGSLSSLQDVANNPRYTFIEGDITDADAVDRAMRGCDTVVHFAAESHVDRSIHDPLAFVRTNVLGTQTLLNAVRKHGNIHFHHVSTDEVFGSLAPKDAPWTERSPYAARSPYSASKAASDHLVRAAYTTHNIPITISNCSNNYGPYHFPEKIIPLFITNLLDGKKVPIYGDGAQIRDWIYVEDHVRGIEAILTRGKVGETYFLGGENQTTNLELTKKILALMEKDESHIEHVQDRPGHDRRYDLSIEKARRELGWSPQVTLDEGLAQTVSWYKAREDWWRPLR